MAWMIRLLKGALIGLTDPIPGISGGTVAYLTGLYDQIVERVSRFVAHPDGWRGNVRYLLPVVLGFFVSVFAFAHIIVWIIERYPAFTKAAFVGFVIGNLVVMVRTRAVALNGPTAQLSLIIAFAVALSFSLLSRPDLDEPIRHPGAMEAIYLFFCGALASAAMLVPGFSGTLLQLIIGSYGTYVTAIKELNAVVLLVFFSGSVVGIVAMARLLGYLFRHHGQTLQLLVGGLVLGSVVLLWPWQSRASVQVQSLMLALSVAGLPVLLDCLRQQKE